MGTHKETEETLNELRNYDHWIVQALRELPLEVSQTLPNLCSLLVHHQPKDPKVCAHLKAYYTKLPKKRLVFFCELYHETIHDLVEKNMKLVRELDRIRGVACPEGQKEEGVRLSDVIKI